MLVNGTSVQNITDLKDRKAQHWSCYIAYPHTQDHRHEHIGDENDLGFISCLGEDKCSHQLCNMILR